MKTYLGIDVSKDSLSVATPRVKTAWQVNTFANSPDGIRSLLKHLPAEAHCVLEATAAADRRLLFGAGHLHALPSRSSGFSSQSQAKPPLCPDAPVVN